MASALDVAIRQQAYLEEVKNHEAEAIDPALAALLSLLSAMLIRWGVKKLSDLPKRDIRAFAAEFNKRASKELLAFRKGFIDDLKAITKIETLVSSKNLAYLTGKGRPQVKQSTTWAAVTNDPIPGVGYMPLQMVRDFTSSIIHKIGLVFWRAYAEGWTPADVLRELNGTRANGFRDGLFRKFRNEFNTVAQTLIQHIHSTVSFMLGRLFYDKYQWVSVLDGSTTEICRSRAGKIYDYATGPRPPAHYNCRSTIVGITVPVRQPNRYYDWLKGQPVSVQNNILGAGQARQLRAGKLGASDVPRFLSNRKLTPEAFGKRQPNMIKD